MKENDVPAMDANSFVEQFKSLITIEDDDITVDVKLGWITLATINEEDGMWYVSMNNKEIGMGKPTKEQALQYLLEYFKED
jgi:hypothetical protein